MAVLLELIPPSGAAMLDAALSQPIVNTSPADPAPRSEIVFIDTGIEDYQTLVDGVRPGIEVVLIDNSRDGLQQIAEALDGRTGVSALHVISHGAEGMLELGSSRLTLDNLETYAPEMATIRAALSESADILLYGCNVAAGKGVGFIEALAQATNADVAASADITGSPQSGRNWALEADTGNVESGNVLQGSEDIYFTGDLASIVSTVKLDFQSETWNTGGVSLGPNYQNSNFKFSYSDGNQPGSVFGINLIDIQGTNSLAFMGKNLSISIESANGDEFTFSEASFILEKLTSDIRFLHFEGFRDGLSQGFISQVRRRRQSSNKLFRK